MIEFHLDGRSGVAPYMQLIHQVRHALRLGLLREGDQLPKVKDVAAGLAINPNTVLKAYRELELKGLVEGRPGQGTFVTATLNQVGLPELHKLRRSLLNWCSAADDAGLDASGMAALFASVVRDFGERSTGPGTDRGVAGDESEGVA